MTEPLKMLIVDHHGSLGSVVGQLAKQSGWEPFVVELRSDDLGSVVNEKAMDLIVCDSTAAKEGLDVTSRTKLVEMIHSAGLKVPIFLLEDEGVDVRIDPEVMKGLGSVRIFRKPISISEMRNAIREEQQKIESLRNGKA